MREGISPVKEFDTSDVDEAERAAERNKKKGQPKPEVAAALHAVRELAANKAKAETETKLAKTRADLANISEKEIDSAVGGLEETEELTEKDLEELN